MSKYALRWLFSVTVICWTTAAEAQSFITSCAAALTPTEVSGSDNLAVSYAYLSNKLEKTDEHSNAGGGITVPIYGVPVSLSYSQAQAKKQELASTLGVNWNANQSHAYMARYVSASSNSTFSQCVRDALSANKAVLLEIVDSGDNYVSVSIHIGTQAALTGDIELDLSSNGQFSHGVQRAWRISGGTTTVVINKSNPARNLHVTARVRGGGYELGSDEIVIPPSIKTVRRFATITKVSQPSQANCGGVRGRVEEGRGPTISIDAGPNETLEPSSASQQEVGRINGRPDVPLNPQQFHMEVLQQDARTISARAWCGIWANEHYSWTGRMTVAARVTSESVVPIADNGANATENRAPPP